MSTEDLCSLFVETGFQESAEVLADWRDAAWRVSSLPDKGPQRKVTVYYCFLEHEPPVREARFVVKAQSNVKAGGRNKAEPFF